jgi:hypothetical protein
MAFRRMQAAVQQTPPDPHRLRLAQRDRDWAQRMVTEGLATVEAILAKSPRCWNAGWLEHGLRQVQYDLALYTGDREAAAEAAQFAVAAREALARELERQPHNPRYALAFATLAGPELSIDALFDLLARPIRYHRLPPDYLDFFGRVVGNEGFQVAFEDLMASRLTASPSSDPQEGESSIAPERFRVAAIVRIVQHRYDEAAALLRQAVALYAQIPTDTIGPASCWAELADCLFFADPDHPRRAVQAAETALKLLPQSEVGRLVKDAIHQRLITYNLAVAAAMETPAEHEAFVRSNLLAPLVRAAGPDPEDEGAVEKREAEFYREIARRYVRMCESFLWGEAGELPRDIRRWSRRALELDGENLNAWLIAADLASRDGQDEDCVDALRRVLEGGGDPRAIYPFLQTALARSPESPALIAFDEAFREQFGIREPPATTQPTTAPTTRPASVPQTQPALAPLLQPTTQAVRSD